MKTYLTPRHATATCRECGTIHERLTVESDEDGAYVEVPTIPCQDDDCSKQLCSSCPQFTCDCCGLTCCRSHLGQEIEPECTCTQLDVDYFDARDCDLHGNHARPVLLCRVCAPPEERMAPAAERVSGEEAA